MIFLRFHEVCRRSIIKVLGNKMMRAKLIEFKDNRWWVGRFDHGTNGLTSSAAHRVSTRPYAVSTKNTSICLIVYDVIVHWSSVRRKKLVKPNLF